MSIKSSNNSPAEPHIDSDALGPYNKRAYRVSLVDVNGNPYTASGGGGGTVTANQGTAGASPWPVVINAGSNVIGSISNTTFASTQSGAWSVTLGSGTNAIGSITNTSFGATQSGVWSVSLNSSTNIVGRFGIDQTTPGTTNATANQGVYQSTPPTLTNNQYSTIQLNTSGSQIIQQQDGQTVTLSGSAAGALTNATYTTGAIPTAGYQSLSVQYSASVTGNSIIFQGSNDNTNWVIVGAQSTSNIGGGPAFASSLSVGTSPVQFVVPAQFAYFRVNITTYGSGTVTAVVTMKVTPVAPIATYATIGNTPNVSAIGTAVSTSGGLATMARFSSSTATTMATLVKSTPGRVMKIRGFNAATTARRLKLHNSASTPVPGTTAVFDVFYLPPGAFSFDASDIGWYFSAGIGYSITQGSLDSDTTALAAGDITDFSIAYI